MSLPPRFGVPPAVPMTREAVDDALARLRSAHDRIAASMYAVDSHAGLAFLRSGGLTGTTGKVAGDVQELIALLWAQFSAFSHYLERAEDTRAARSRPGNAELVALTQLLRDRVVGLGDDGLPLDGTGTAAGVGVGVGTGAAAKVVTLSELAHELERSTSGLAQLLTEVDTAVSTVVGQVAAATDALGEVRTRAAGFEGADLGRAVDLAGLAAALDEARAQALADPIEVARGGAQATAVAGRLRRLATEVDGARRRLDELVRVRDEHPLLLAEVRGTVEAVAVAQTEATRSYQVVRVKIANPGLPEVPATVAGLRDRLARLEQLAQQSRWARLADELAGLEHAAAEARAYALRLRDAADGLMARRTELRGRLDAYRAKAARLGYGEHAELSEAYRQAKDILYTSPCQLPAATRAVFHYQQSLADLTRKETRR